MFSETEMDVTNPDIKQLNDQYATKISSGQIAVGYTQKEKLSPDKKFDMLMKRKKIGQAEREKAVLEKKLAYLQKSIDSIQNYDFVAGRVQDESPRSNSMMNQQTQKKQFKEAKIKYKQEKEKIKQRKQQEQKKKRERQEQTLAVKKRVNEQQKAKKRKQILQNVQKIKKEMQQRQRQLQKRDQEYKAVRGRQTLANKIQAQSQQREKCLLQQRKKKLAIIRSMHQPVTMAEIEQHQTSFVNALKQKEEMRSRERRLSRATQEYKVSYKSPRHQQYSHPKEQSDQSRIKTQKVKQFAEHVRQNFVPEIDQNKRQAIQKLIEQEGQKLKQSQVKKEQERQHAQGIRLKGLRYLQELKQMPKRSESATQKDDAVKSTSVGPHTERPKYQNYITHSGRSSGGQWRRILEGEVSTKEKAIRMKFQSQKMENSLRMREQKARLLKNNPDDIDEEYFQMIKAKLDLLQKN